MRVTKAIPIVVLLFLAFFLGGCKSTRQIDPIYSEIQGSVLNRIVPDHKHIPLDIKNEDRTKIISTILEGGNLTREAAVLLALLTNPKLQASFQALNISDAEIIKAKKISNPSVEIMVRESDESDSSTNSEFTVVQNILDFLVRPTLSKRANAEFERIKISLVNEALKLALDVELHVLSSQAAMKKLEYLKEIYETTTLASEFAVKQYEEGNISSLDLALQQKTHQQVKLDLGRQEMIVASTRNALNQLLGLWGANKNWKLKPNLPGIPENELSTQSDEAKALNSNLELAALHLNREILHQNDSLARKEILGDVHLGFNTEREPEGEQLTGGILEFGLPIFNRNQGERLRIEAFQRQNEFEIEAKAIEIRLQHATLLKNIDSLGNRIKYFQESVLPLHLKIVVLNQQLYNTMFIGTYKLLEAKENEIMTKIAYTDLQHEYWESYTKLKYLFAGVSSHLTVKSMREPRAANTKSDDH